MTDYQLGDGAAGLPAESTPRSAPRTRSGTTKVLVATLVFIAALGLFAFALVYTGAADTLMAGGFDLGSLFASGADPAVGGTGTGSVQTTDVASGVATFPLVAGKQLFYEQIASQDTIGELLDNKFSRFDLRPADSSNSRAKVRVKATYRSGASFSGTMVLDKIEGGWYFSTITRDGSRQVLPSTPAYDQAVVHAVVEEQSKRQKTIEAILDGTYDQLRIDEVKTGSGTKTVIGTLVGGNEKDPSEIVAISKVIDGTQYWFIASIR